MRCQPCSPRPRPLLNADPISVHADAVAAAALPADLAHTAVLEDADSMADIEDAVDMVDAAVDADTEATVAVDAETMAAVAATEAATDTEDVVDATEITGLP